MPKLTSSLRFRLIALVVISLLPALLLSLYSGLEQRRLAANSAKEEALRLTRLAAGNQAALAEGASQLLVSLSNIPDIANPQPGPCSSFLSRLVQQYPSYSNIIVANPDGDVVCSAFPPESPVNVVDLPYFQEAVESGHFVASEYSFGRIVKVPIQPFALPVYDENGTLTSIISASVSLDWMNALMAQANLPAGSVLMAVDANGTILSRSPSSPEWVGKNLPEEPIIEAMLNHAEGTLQTTGIDDVNRLYAFTRIEYEGDFVANVTIGIPSSVAFRDADRSLLRNLVSLAGVFVLAIFAAWSFGNLFVVRHVNMLLSATRSLAGGDLSARTGLDSSSGELGELGSSFDSMAASLQERDTELTQAEARYRALVEHIPAVAYTSMPGESGKTVYVSPQVQSVLGYSQAEWLSQPELWQKNIHPNDCKWVLAELARTRLNGDPFTVEYRWCRSDQTWIWLRDEAILVLDTDAKPLFLQGIIFDVTRSKQAEAALENYARRLERSNRELQDFAFIASHDLQEPLRKIQAFGERLQTKYAGHFDESGNTYLERMIESASRLQNLINDLLSYSRIASKTRPFVLVDLNRVAADVLSDLETSIREAGTHVTIEKLPTVMADDLQMRQLFQNLIGNAVKFRKKDAASIVHVFARAYESDTSDPYPKVPAGMVQIIVRDNGIGFDEKYLDRIFAPFQRLHGRTEYKGSGIGLAICRKIVDRHHGTLTAASQPNQGAAFIVTLPVQQPENSPGESL